MKRNLRVPAAAVMLLGLVAAAVAQNDATRGAVEAAIGFIIGNRQSQESAALQNATYGANAGHARLARFNADMSNPELTSFGPEIVQELVSTLVRAQQNYGNAAQIFGQMTENGEEFALADEQRAALDRLGYPTDPKTLTARLAMETGAVATLLNSVMVATDADGVIDLQLYPDGVENVEPALALGSAMQLSSRLNAVMLILGPIPGAQNVAVGLPSPAQF
ncbi:hypothetical protein [Paracoccus xiamenensis]|uniref:hypothetical protein n=1 Tax=Paracoccus xiamenensis TaxID=2714901 RepID=UPI00140B5AD0|nr:hypothetical protein [Paracoccus xiamenensis]NHF74704.1 hypothetical protein [Paracoccus xiamenensis]